jgi:N-acetyl-anhydromuramyl-L-alanine amidase AmpD
MAGSSIIVCGRRFDVGQKVVTFEDDPNFSAYTKHRTDVPSQIYPFQPAKGMGAMAERYRARRLIGADRSLERLKQVLRQFVVHHDGCQDSKMCFQVLHNERGLSVHFLIDNDGTIYQTLDLVDCAFQAAGVNEISIGVELANRGDALRFPNDYHGKRDKVTCTIHKHQFLAYDYTKAQNDSMISLGKALARIFPNLPQTAPMGSDGQPMWTNLSDPREYAGYLGHYHITDQKWDPGPYDFKYLTSKIRGKMVFPVIVSGDKPDLPEEEDKAEELAQQLYDNNETEGEGGGYFPVGPFGTSRLWHGGVHLRFDAGTPVYAPFGGKVVAARMSEDCPIGSRNFVLIKHEFAVGTAQLKFWTLLMHLKEESPGPEAPAWWTKVASQLGDDPVTLSVDVAAGEIVGHVGEAGPPGQQAGALHVEIFSADEIGDKVEPGYWKLIDGSSSGRFCDAAEIVDKIDRPGPNGRKDGVLSRLELMNFYRGNPQREEFRKMATRHLSEWADNNDWAAVIKRGAREFPNLKADTIYKQQIEPVLWWNDDVQDAAGLPSDKLVWTYHPVTFIVWVHDKLTHSVQTSSGREDESKFGGKPPPSNIKDDLEALEGFADDEDVFFGSGGKKLDLEDLANGYPDDKKDKDKDK